METKKSSLLMSDIRVFHLKDDLDENELQTLLAEKRKTEIIILETKNSKIALEMTLLQEDIQTSLDIIEPENLDNETLSLVSQALNALKEKMEQEHENDKK